MKKDIKVSVIVPVYNVEKYLDQCLNSLVNQTLEEIEIIVVNDGSPDNSQFIINDYVKRYPKKVFSYIKENGGLSSARNYGVEKAKGEYLSFIDSDDYIDFDMLETMYNKVTKTDSDVVVCGITNLYKYKIELNYIEHEEVFGHSLKESPDIMIHSRSYACNKLYKRSWFVKNNFKFPVGQYFEDSALIYNILYLANKVEVVNIPFYQYNRINGGSIVNTINEKIFDIFKSCDSLLNFYQDKGESLYKNACNLCLSHIAARISYFKGSKDYKLIKKYIRYANNYLDQHIPLWKDENYIKGLVYQPRFMISGLKIIQHYYKYRFRKLRRIIKKPYKLLKKQFIKRKKVTNQSNAIVTTTNKVLDITALNLIFNLCNEYGWNCFCTLRTLLEIAQNNVITSKRLSVGVLTDTNIASQMRYELISKGFILDREYFYKDVIRQQDFKFKKLSITIKYYESEKNKMFSYQFYRDADEVYAAYTMQVLRLVTPLITSTKKVVVNNVELLIPSNFMSILKCIYGEELNDLKLNYHKEENTNYVLGCVKRVTCNHVESFKPKSAPKNKEDFLKQLHEIELDILKEVDRVCKKEGLTYYMGEGSLLGAIRHQGFIPWDDDIDILMPRNDYERFLKIAPKIISKKYEIQHSTTIDNYWSPFIKVRYLDNSFYSQKHIAHLTNHNGPLIDIFPLDNVPKKDSIRQYLQAMRIKFNRGMLSYKLKIRIPKKWKGYIVRFISNFVSVKHIHNVLRKTFIKYNNKDNPYIVNLASYYSYKKQIVPKEWYGKPRMVKFENLKVPVPHEAEKLLTSIYGDYMQLPPVEKRKIKHHF